MFLDGASENVFDEVCFVIDKMQQLFLSTKILEDFKDLEFRISFGFFTIFKSLNITHLDNMQTLINSSINAK